MTKQHDPSRRELLHRMAALTGGALTAPTVAAILGGATAADSPSSQLDADQLSLVAAIADTIIPETDTPSASAAGTHLFVQVMLSDWYNEQEREPILSGLTAINEQAIVLEGVKFAQCTPEQQHTILSTFDAAAFKQDAEEHFFRRLKELVVVGYYTSEIGASEELRYESVPGPYKGCVPLSDVGRTWAL